MAKSTIPVNLLNPGQVLACLGFLEAADVLLGDATGGFDWSDRTETMYSLSARGDRNPVEVVLEFLARAKVRAVAPRGWRPKKEPDSETKRQKLEVELGQQGQSETFPCAQPDTSSAMPIELVGMCGPKLGLSHWADGSSRNQFKLYAGNRSALTIAKAMLERVSELWRDQQDDLTKSPFDVLTAMGGSFNFDPRGAWTAIEIGYSPNTQRHLVGASPVVEVLAACGLENARPDEYETRKVRYATWGLPLPPVLGRTALAGRIPSVPMRRFRFDLALTGKNKIITLADEEYIND